MFLLADKNATFWFPEQASTFAAEVDWFYMAMLYISLFFFVLIVAAMVYFAFAFRDRPGYKGSVEALHNNWLEFWWTFIPCVIMVWIFARGVYGYLDMMTIPVDAENIDVVARKWSWTFKYPGGVETGGVKDADLNKDTPDNGLHLVVDRPTVVTMRSEDVLHAFFVPVFRAKSDIVPGRYTKMWFHPTKVGEYDLFCAEYCGDKHSKMRAKVHVQTQEDYDKWLAHEMLPPANPWDWGKKQYEKSKGCIACHSIENKKVVGPSFLGSWGKDVELASGGTVKFDENYVRESVLNPQAKARKGFETASQMPSYQGRLKEEEIAALIEFLKDVTTNPTKTDDTKAEKTPTDKTTEDKTKTK